MSVTVQELLTDAAPLILDSTCSFKRIWPAFASVRMDKRFETSPDVVADCRYLPFRPSVFQNIYCDPPHLKITGTDEAFLERMRKFAKRTGRQVTSNFSRYGWWHNREEWLDFVRKSGAEFRRCIKTGGILHYKITDTDITALKDLDEMSEWQRQRQRQRQRHSQSKGKYRKRIVTFAEFVAAPATKTTSDDDAKAKRVSQFTNDI